MKTEAISESTRSEWKPTFDWANSVKAVTKASSSSVSAVFMDTLMMWIGFSLLFWRGWEQNQQLRGNGRQKPFHVHNSAHPEVVLLIQAGGLWIRSRLQERLREAGENFIKIPAKDKKGNISRQRLCSDIFIRIKTRGKSFIIKFKATFWSRRHTGKPPWRPFADREETRIRPGRARCSAASF